MLPDRSNIRVVDPDIVLVVQMDGLGLQETKLESWQAITAGGQAGIHFGWKNFYDEDSPLRSPAATGGIGAIARLHLVPIAATPATTESIRDRSPGDHPSVAATTSQRPREDAS